MNALHSLVQHQNDVLNTRLETFHVIDALVKKVEASVSVETHKEHEGQLMAAARLTRHFVLKVKKLKDQNDELVRQMIILRNGAQAVREKFAIDIGRMLSESKEAVDSKVKMKELRLNLRDQRKQNKTYRNKEKTMQGEIEQLKKKIEEMEQELINRAKEIEERKGSTMSDSQTSHDQSAEESKIKEDNIFARSAVDEVDSFFSELSINNASVEDQSRAETATIARQINDTSPKQSAKYAIKARTHCILSDLEDTELLEILTFLNTGEVLATAQANRFIFTRVDEMFSLESKIAKPNWKIRKEMHITEQSEQDKAGGGVGADGDNPSVGNNGETPSDKPEEQQQEQQHQQQQQQQQNAVQNFFSSLTSTLTNQISGVGALDGVDPELCILPPPVLELLRAKLTAAEMKAISNLNQVAETNLKKTEELMAEKEDILQRLGNTETVRDFLISKLKSAEKALKSSIKEISGCRKQAAADGEVIHYLDTRGVELDSRVKELEAKRQSLQTAYDLYRSTHSHNEKRLSDELLALKAAQMQSELSHKAEKKLLVKEIKALRASLEKTNSERHVYAAQLRSITQALKLGDHSIGDNRTRQSGSTTRRRGSHENIK